MYIFPYNAILLPERCGPCHHLRGIDLRCPIVLITDHWNLSVLEFKPSGDIDEGGEKDHDGRLPHAAPDSGMRQLSVI